MNRLTIPAGLVAGLIATSGPSFAAPGELAPEPASLGHAAIGEPIIQHRLEVEMTVRNWVLCATQPSAETLVHAREEGIDAAAEALSQLTADRACGLFPEMQVILQKPLYDATLATGEQASIYGALVNISGAWASAYVVYGSVPVE